MSCILPLLCVRRFFVVFVPPRGARGSRRDRAKLQSIKATGGGGEEEAVKKAVDALQGGA